MEGLTTMKWECSDCEGTFKKSEKTKHEDLTDHKVKDRGFIVKSKDPLEIVVDFHKIEKELIKPLITKAVKKEPDVVLKIAEPLQADEDFHFTGDPATDYPNTWGALQNLKMLMKANGIILGNIGE